MAQPKKSSLVISTTSEFIEESSVAKGYGGQVVTRIFTGLPSVAFAKDGFFVPACQRMSAEMADRAKEGLLLLDISKK